MLKKISLVTMLVLYVAAGVNHFVHPQMYLAIIPPYLPWPVMINAVSGIAEILLGVLLIPRPTRHIASVGIILMLGAFIPAHIYMIQQNGCVDKGVCIPLWAAWLRLIPLQFILMYWAWANRK